ncbi:MAG: TrmH family RNA methyltransferase [Flavobacteriales bacterium]|jgi:TrmH family RNA methyltransferase|tara:strand:- start:4904 stop:5641 length:738 start_codon:yes stop_codon:yes gene_type:complete
MVSKRDIKLISSLKQKKFRDLNRFFVVEGKKSILEFIDSKFKLVKLFSIDCSVFNDIENQIDVSSDEFKKISFFNNPDDHLAIFEIPKNKPVNQNKLIVALESIRDPGNLGTIIRTCEWFGVKDVICSNDSVDCFNPKVVQSAMGSLSRMNINYVDLNSYLKSSKLELIGTTLNGKSLYETNLLIEKGILIFGNEANGISDTLSSMLNHNLTIPRSVNSHVPESLNLSISVGVILGEIKRKSFSN